MGNISGIGPPGVEMELNFQFPSNLIPKLLISENYFFVFRFQNIIIF